MRRQDTTKRTGKKFAIDIKDIVIIKDVNLESLRKVQKEAKEARLGVDHGASTAIAYLIEATEKITFCTCDKAAIKLISFMELDQKAISLENALKSTGYNGKKLYPRHLEVLYSMRHSSHDSGIITHMMCQGISLQVWKEITLINVFDFL